MENTTNNNYTNTTENLNRLQEEQNSAIGFDEIEREAREARRAKAKKDMLAGGLFCGIGTILTLADIGFIFWGAIVFGGIQFVRGVINFK